MPKLVDVNGSVQIWNDRDQLVATFDSVSGLPIVKQTGVAGKTSIPTSDPLVKDKPYLSSGTVKYSNG